jgi:hypothetical protein
MFPAFIDPGIVGSPVDVVTLIVVLVRFHPRINLVAAAVVALARGRDDVDDDHLAHELGVEESAIEMLRPEVIYRQEGEDG